MKETRPDPQALLRQAAQEGRGRLKIFLGAAPGVGKTFEMLSEGQARRREGVDLIVGVVETHGRVETEALTRALDIVPRRASPHEGHVLHEMDLDAVLARAPRLVLVDELAHSNAPGSRHPKRYQDVEELLAAGIDVYSTLNIQHVESLNDIVAGFTRVRVRETVPDRILEAAEIEVVDIPPDELIERLNAGKVYLPHEATRALDHFFSKSNLSALRELALTRAAQAVDAQMLDHVRAMGLGGTWAGAERIVVAINELSGADGLVRAAKRVADGLRGPWTALFVETPRVTGFSDVQHAAVAATMTLATQLGATVAVVPATNVVDGIKAFLVDARATQLVVGKSLRSRWFEWRHGSVVDRLVRETPGVTVHVLPIDRGSMPVAARKRSASWGSRTGYAVTTVMVAGITAAASALFQVLNLGNVALLYLLPVMAAASLYGLRTGLFAGIASSLAYNFFFLPPTGTLTVSNPENVVSILVLLGVAIATSQLTSRVHAQADLAAASARANAALTGFLRRLTEIGDADAMRRELVGEIALILGVQAVLLAPGPTGSLSVQAADAEGYLLGTLDVAAAQWAYDNAMVTGRGSTTLTASEWAFHPLTHGGRTLAVFGLARDGADPVRADRLPLLTSLLDQGALVLERMRLAGEMRDVETVRTRDRLRGALLSSVSHDLRTPLTAVRAAAAELRHGATPDLIDTIEQETQRLDRFVANLLDMARIEGGALDLKIEPVDLSDAVTGAAHDARAALAGHAIRLDVPPDLPLVRCDPQLLHHCLLNLLDNAGRYADPGSDIRIAGEHRHGVLRLSVIDIGPGLPPGQEPVVFDTFRRFDGSDRSAGGTGLGLAIVKAFAEAMGMAVEARNRDTGDGAVFTLVFPGSALVHSTAGEGDI